jgi:hypothetical protein
VRVELFVQQTGDISLALAEDVKDREDETAKCVSSAFQAAAPVVPHGQGIARYDVTFAAR